MSRTDTHSPSNFDPAEYEFDDILFQGSGDQAWMAMGPAAVEFIRAEREKRERIRRDAGWRGNWVEKTTCDHCGAWFAYGAVFRHLPTQQLVVVGHICADKAFGHNDRRAYEASRLRARVAAFRERERMQGAAQEFLDEHPDLDEALRFDHHISRDLQDSLLRYGRLSDKQVALAMKIPVDQAERAERAERRAREEAERAERDIPAWDTGRVDIKGRVLAAKWKDSDYGCSLKLLVELDDGRRCWGSAAAALGDDADVLRDSRVAFRATFTPSDDDPRFAFFKRPSNAEVTT